MIFKKKSKDQALEKKQPLDGDYPGLNSLSWLIGYLEQFLAIISEPLLIGCAAIAVIDFITAGQLLENQIVNYTWAGSLAIAVTACFIVTWRRAIKAFTYNRYGAGIALGFLGITLGLVDFTAIAVQTLEQTAHVTFSQALELLNLNIIAITYIRSGVAIAMAVVVAVSNNVAVSSATAPKRRLAVWDRMIDRIAPTVEQGVEPLNVQPSNGSSAWPHGVQLAPTNGHVHTVHPAQGVQLTGALLEPAPTNGHVHTVQSEHLPRLSIVQSNIGQGVQPAPIERIRQALKQEPGVSNRAIAELSNTSPSTVGKHRKRLEQENREVV